MTDKEQAAQGVLILRRLVPAPDHGLGFRRDPETGFVYYSSEWLSDDAALCRIHNIWKVAGSCHLCDGYDSLTRPKPSA